MIKRHEDAGWALRMSKVNLKKKVAYRWVGTLI
jgi:hypothetical protein